MLHPIDFETRLGFDHIRRKLTDLCLSGSGISRVAEMQFSASHHQVSTWLKQTREFKQIFEKGENFPANHYLDAREILKKSSLEGNYLDESEFLQLAYSLQTIIECRNFLTKSQEFYPALFALTEQVIIDKSLVNGILAVIDDHAQVKDSASQELSRIRKRLRDEQGKVRKLIDQAYRHAIAQQWVPEGALPTIREGRLVIPILAEHKRRMKGFILDESATGQTVFMEPTDALDANNEIRDLEHAEKREVIRILKALTSQLRMQMTELEAAFDFLGHLDFIRAKAKLSLELVADMPLVSDKPVIRWIKARHPVLFMTLKGKREIVSLDVDLSEHNRMLLVSGPNAGGKSVCLKTVGILQYMLQCGLLVPASPDSQAGIFNDIFIDIGDQQSIENDLSTYSSHLKNMSFFLQHAGTQSLVLMDELGAGTDPNFGGAIAESILHGLLTRKVWGVATTHYYNLKLFAENQAGIRNAAMRFDENKLVPLYILDIGKPGSSFALEIAEKTGLPEQTLQEAKELVGKELMGFESLVRTLEKEKNELSERVSGLEKQERELKSLLSKYDSLTSELESRKKEIIDKAKVEANALLRETNKEIEKTIRHIRENQAERKETLKVRKSLQQLSQKVEHEPLVKKEKAVTGAVNAGDRVRIIGQDSSGTVLTVKGKNATVQFGDLKSTVAVTRLEKLGGKTVVEVSERPVSTGIRLHEKQAQFNPTLDIRGKRVEEVVPVLEQFLDNAILLGHGEIKILHGKGEGVLRKVVREQLRKYKQVASAADEHVDRGGDGITVVVLK
jgi:DNA mismatch repair protein MutS2